MDEVERLSELRQEEEETANSDWRDDLDEDDELALRIMECGGKAGKEYYIEGKDLFLADDYDSNLSEGVDSSEADEYWRDMDVEELREWVERLGCKAIAVAQIDKYAKDIRDMLTDS